MYLFLDRRKGREKERERNTSCERHINLLSLACPQLGTYGEPFQAGGNVAQPPLGKASGEQVSVGRTHAHG